MPPLVLKLRRNKENAAVLKLDRVSIDMEEARIVEQGPVDPVGAKRKSPDEDDDFELLRATLILKVKRPKAQASGLSGPQVKRRRVESPSPESAMKRTNSDSAVSREISETIDSVYEEAEKEARVILENDPSNGKVCFRSYEKEMASLVPKVRWRLKKAVKHRGSEKGRNAMIDVDELMICSSGTLSLTSTGIAAAARDPNAMNVSKLTTALSYGLCLCEEIDSCNIRPG